MSHKRAEFGDECMLMFLCDDKQTILPIKVNYSLTVIKSNDTTSYSISFDSLDISRNRLRNNVLFAQSCPRALRMSL